VRVEPPDLVGVGASDRLPGEPPTAAQDRVFVAQGDQSAGEGQEAGLVLDVLPVEPGQLVVLAVGVVVAELGSSALVAYQQHGDALGQQQRGEQVALLAATQGVDLRVVGGTLGAAVPA